jgi:hypothetical protein
VTCATGGLVVTVCVHRGHRGWLTAAFVWATMAGNIGTKIAYIWKDRTMFIACHKKVLTGGNRRQ